MTSRSSEVGFPQEELYRPLPFIFLESEVREDDSMMPLANHTV